MQVVYKYESTQSTHKDGSLPAEANVVDKARTDELFPSWWCSARVVRHFFENLAEDYHFMGPSLSTDFLSMWLTNTWPRNNTAKFWPFSRLLIQLQTQSSAHSDESLMSYTRPYLTTKLGSSAKQSVPRHDKVLWVLYEAKPSERNPLTSDRLCKLRKAN